MKIRDIKYYFREAFKGFKRNRAMSTTSIVSVTATLFVIGIFLMIASNINKMTANLEDQVEIKAYVEDGLKEDTIEFSLGKAREIPGVKEVFYMSKEDALEDYRKTLGENANILDGLEDRNPLPASYTVILEDTSYAKSVAAALEDFSSIEQVEYGREILDQLLKVTAGLRLGCVILIAILFLISTFIIANTIKLTLHARRREISIMKYVGATDWFVRWPFIIEGVIIGFIGSIVTSAILSGLYFYLYQMVTKANLGLMNFEMVPLANLAFGLVGSVMVIGIAIGFLGSAFSVRKFLKV